MNSCSIENINWNQSNRFPAYLGWHDCVILITVGIFTPGDLIGIYYISGKRIIIILILIILIYRCCFQIHVTLLPWVFSIFPRILIWVSVSHPLNKWKPTHTWNLVHILFLAKKKLPKRPRWKKYNWMCPRQSIEYIWIHLLT